MFRLTVLAASLAMAVFASAGAHTVAPQVAQAGMPPVDPPLTVKPLRGGAYWVEGGVANTGFIIGDSGVVVIDAQMFVEGARRVQAEIGKLTSKPISQIVLTHSDSDHVLGLPAYPPGTPVIAHEQVKADMQAAVADPRARPAVRDLKDFLPTHTVAHREDMVLAGVRLTLLNWGPAHTNGDLAVYLPAQKLVFAGDLVTPAIGAYPGIHLCKKGTSLGWIAAAEALLALDADTYVGGHGEPLNRKELQMRIDAAKQRRAQIQALVGQGMTLAEIKAAVGDVALAGLAARFPTFTATTYQELSASGPDCAAPAGPATH